MLKRRDIAPEDVHSTLREHLLVDGYPIVIDFENSCGSYLRDAISGCDYLDFFSFFASNPIGFNHASMLDVETQARLARVATTKVSNADYYSTYMAEFVDTFARSAAPPELPHYFFIDGGALAVENAMKAAFDWKVRKNLSQGLAGQGDQILHLEHAFHGRSGYALSVTNTDPTKTLHYPKFDWPRIPCPKLGFPLTPERLAFAETAEDQAIDAASQAFAARPHRIAAILVEPIQGEGGDQHFRPDFFRRLRGLADEHEALLIYDEVQTGLGITGKWWAYQHHGVAPDILCFAKKMQVGGIAASARLDEVADNVFKVPSRINSTWGASLVDMVRCTRILEIIENENLLSNASARGSELLLGLTTLTERFPDQLSNARGSGLMCAIDVVTTELRNQIIRQCFEDQVIVLASGRNAIRFRPTLAVPPEAIALGLARLSGAVERCIAKA